MSVHWECTQRCKTLPSDLSADVDCPIDVSEVTDWLIEVLMYPLMSVDFDVVAVLDGDGRTL